MIYYLFSLSYERYNILQIEYFRGSNMLNFQYLRRIHLKREEIPSFNKYPFNLTAIKTLDELVFHPNVTFLIGENGMGKSTLLEAIAVALGFNPEVDPLILISPPMILTLR